MRNRRQRRRTRLLLLCVVGTVSVVLATISYATGVFETVKPLNRRRSLLDTGSAAAAVGHRCRRDRRSNLERGPAAVSAHRRRRGDQPAVAGRREGDRVRRAVRRPEQRPRTVLPRDRRLRAASGLRPGDGHHQGPKCRLLGDGGEREGAAEHVRRGRPQFPARQRRPHQRAHRRRRNRSPRVLFVAGDSQLCRRSGRAGDRQGPRPRDVRSDG